MDIATGLGLLAGFAVIGTSPEGEHLMLLNFPEDN